MFALGLLYSMLKTKHDINGMVKILVDLNFVVCTISVIMCNNLVIADSHRCTTSSNQAVASMHIFVFYNFGRLLPAVQDHSSEKIGATFTALLLLMPAVQGMGTRNC